MRERDQILALRSAVAVLRVTAGVHRRDALAPDADLHIDALRVEELSGDIDGTNRWFRSEYTPVGTAGRLTLCFIRRLAHVAGDGYQQNGRNWVMDEAPQVDGRVDVRPFAIYFRDPRLPEIEFDITTMVSPGLRARGEAAWGLDWASDDDEWWPRAKARTMIP